MTQKTLILGAGIAGLAAAYRLDQLNKPYCIYEKNSRAGGLLDSIKIGRFRFDQAVHLSFADQPEVRKIFDKTPYITHEPESKCFDEGRWLRHPIQTNLYPLSVPEKVSLIKSFIARPDITPKNYYDWLVFQYGEEFAKRYPVRYTKKYWDISPEKLGLDWIGKRMHRATLEEVLAGAMTDETPNYYYAKEMRYPNKGGYKSFLEPLKEKVFPIFNKECISIDLTEKKAFFKDGEVVEFKQVINTLPLPVLIRLIRNCPDHILELSKRLLWTKVHLVSIGLNKPNMIKDLWFYIYDDDIYASRAYSPSLKSIDNCPKECSSIQFEIYETADRPQRYTTEELKKNCIYALKKMKIASEEDIQICDLRTVPFGNVIFYSGMEQERDEILFWLNKLGVVGAGRFGAWDYLWSHQSMESGMIAAEKVE
jgi:protoporphyrinogen oxidase